MTVVSVGSGRLIECHSCVAGTAHTRPTNSPNTPSDNHSGHTSADMVTSPARYRMMCAGRQLCKSRALAIEALHTAYTRPGSLSLLISAGETA